MSNYLLLTALLFLLNLCHRDPELPQQVRVSLEEKWSTDSVLRTPESVLYDFKRNVVFVANINQFSPSAKDGDGFISLLNPDGKIQDLKWVEGLNDPKGMGIRGNKLYVADMTELVEIDIDKAEITKRYPVDGAQFLNDITIDAKGTVYISDTGGAKVYELKGDKVVVFLEGTVMEGANGLLAEKDRLIVASAYTGNISLVDYATKNAQVWVSGISYADGIAKDVLHNYFISSWEGEIYYVKKSGDKEKILDTKAAGINAADIDYILHGNLLLVPTFGDNRVVAYKVKYK